MIKIGLFDPQLAITAFILGFMTIALIGRPDLRDYGIRLFADAMDNCYCRRVNDVCPPGCRGM